jgi:hypothetical protein
VQTGLAAGLSGPGLLPAPMINSAIDASRVTSAVVKPNVLSARDCLPSFFVVGPPRTGTTWLHAVLREHTVLPHPIKETRFFDKRFHYGMQWYRGHYGKPTGGHCIGEIAPTYFASPAARDRIARTIPGAKIVCIFRNPVERILSLYRIKRAYGRIPWGFEQALLRDPELLESGRYAFHLRAWQSALSPAQVLACVYDDLREDPQSYVNSLADFIGLRRFTLTPAQIEYVESSSSLTHPRNYYCTKSAILMADWLKARRFGKFVDTVKSSPFRRFLLSSGMPFADLSADLFWKLFGVFRSEIEQLEVLLQRDLSQWKVFNLEQTNPITA